MLEVGVLGKGSEASMCVPRDSASRHPSVPGLGNVGIGLDWATGLDFLVVHTKKKKKKSIKFSLKEV